MTSVKLLHVSAPGCHPQGDFQNKAIQVQHATLGTAYCHRALIWYAVPPDMTHFNVLSGMYLIYILHYKTQIHLL